MKSTTRPRVRPVAGTPAPANEEAPQKAESLFPCWELIEKVVPYEMKGTGKIEFLGGRIVARIGVPMGADISLAPEILPDD